MTAPTDKQAESIAALKNANKHLSDLFTAMHKKDATLSQCASDCRWIARTCGELRVEAYIGTNKQTVLLKDFLNTIATNLDGARS